MNIFLLDMNPVIAARMQCDKHVVKMVTESAQMLSTAHRILDGTPVPSKTKTIKAWTHPEHDDVLYKAVHINHPCTLWTMESKWNYDWHYMHFKSLSTEYRHRYNRQHASFNKLRDILQDSPANIPDIGQTPFRLAMGAAPECIDESDPVGSYRKFYMTKQDRFKMVWTKAEVPYWFERTA